MLNTSTVARRFIEVRAEWKRLQIEIAATKAGTGSPDAKLAITAARAEASTRALAWTLGIDLDLMESPKRIENAHRWYSEMAQEIQAVLDHEGPVQLIPVDIKTLGKDATMAQPDSITESIESVQRWYLLDVPPHTYPDGTQTALWSAFLSSRQVEELREALDEDQLATTSSMTPRDQLTLDFEESDQFDDIGDTSDMDGIGDIDDIEQVETGEGRSAI